MKKVLVVLMVAALATVSQAAVINISSSFTNLDFDSGAVPDLAEFAGTDGWDGYDLSAGDSGVEGPQAWWGTYETNSAFMKNGDGASNLSTYVIQAGDSFNLDFYAKAWGASWAGSDPGEFTVSLFYDDPANIFGSVVVTGITNDVWTAYSTGVIAATAASEGGALGIIFDSTGNRFACLDEVVVSVPEPATMALLGLGALVSLRKRK